MDRLNPGYLLLFTFFLSGVGHQLMYVLFPAVAFLYAYSNDYTLRGNKVTSLYLSFFIFILSLTILQTVAGMDLKTYSIKGVFRYFAYFSLAIFIAHLSLKTISEILNKAIWIFLLFIPYGIIETIVKGRYEFIFHHANNLAYTLVLLIYFACITENRYKWVFLSGLLFSLLLTQSTGGLATSMILIFSFFISNKHMSAARKIILVSAVFILLTGLLCMFPERITEQFRFISQIDWELVADRAKKAKFGMLGSGFWRITYWLAILDEFFRNSPLVIVIGEGLDSLTLGNYIYPFMKKDPHNDYVKLLVETGLTGAVFFFLYYIRKIYLISGSLLMIALVLIPMNFGNILVNFPFMILFITLLNYKLKLKESSIRQQPLPRKVTEAVLLNT